MIRYQPISRRAPLRLAAVAGLFSAILLLSAEPLPAANSAQDQVSRDFQQTVTRGAGQSVHVEHKFGSVEIAGIHGAADVENGYGTLTARDVGAGRWNNAFGSIELTGAEGNVSVSDNNGSVQVADVKGTLEVRNRFGSITTRNIQGAVTITGGNGAVALAEAASANITTSFGNVDARNIRGDLLVRDNNGNVEISGIGGAANITDSFGNVTFSDVRGRVACSTYHGPRKGISVA